MLELRPICEQCARSLPPGATNARICSFECTFCADCVEALLDNVCPNCGGGFVPRPVRPAQNWNDDNCLRAYPPSTNARYRPVDPVKHRAFAAKIRQILPERR